MVPLAVAACGLWCAHVQLHCRPGPATPSRGAAPATWHGCALQSGADMAGVKDGGEALEISRPPWKRAVLAQLEVEGPEADLEVGLGGPQHVEPRLLAAARVLVAVQPNEVQGLSTEALGRWDRWGWPPGTSRACAC